MSNKTLRTMYRRMVEARMTVAPGRLGRATSEDVACWVSSTVGLEADDVVFGCRLPELVRSGLPMALIPGGIERLYAAIGAAAVLRDGKGKRVVVAFFERHEVEKAAWLEGLRMTVELPLMMVVLPRWKGEESAMDLCREARTREVPGLPVDSGDAVAIYRVAQESLVRARADGGAALIEGVKMPGVDAVAGLGNYLSRRGVATQAWMGAVEARFLAQKG